MKKTLQRWIIMTGVVCMTVFGIWGCGSKDASRNGQGVESQEEKEQTDNPEREQPDAADPEEPSVVDPEETAGSEKGSRKTEEEDLTGNIQELGDGQFTVAEVLTEELDDGSVLAISSAPGSDDPDFTYVTVTWDEDTVFYIRTIYDNGARYEDSDASSEDLEKDDMVLLWGTWEGDRETLHADQIQIERFVH